MLYLQRLNYWNGLIIQWGSFDNSVNQRSVNAIINFPIAFTSTGYILNAMARKDTNTYCTGGISVANKNKNSIEVIWYGINADQKIRYLDWFAIGI